VGNRRNKTLGLAAVAALLGVSGVAGASPDDGVETDRRRGFELGLRVGYSRPMGSIAVDARLSDFVSTRVPLWFDLGYRVSPHWYLGAFLQYGFLAVPSGYCATCSAHDITAGVGAAFHAAPYAVLDPWIGLGTGYESVSGSEDVSGASMSFAGFQLCNLQAGADYYMRALALGPFASLSIAEYSTTSFSSPSDSGGPSSAAIKGHALHEWLTIGIRGTFDLVLSP
jgi:hypothetical protein